MIRRYLYRRRNKAFSERLFAWADAEADSPFKEWLKMVPAQMLPVDVVDALRRRYHRANDRSDASRSIGGWVGGYNMGYAAAVGDVLDALGIDPNE